MTKYRLEYVETRIMESGKVVNLPVDKFKYIPLDYVTENYNDADCMRCELCESMNFGFVRIKEEEV